MNHRFAVSSNNSRTRSMGLPATLTHDEWTRTVAFFSGLCAYCAASPAAHIDHFIPVAHGGGTTPGNCLPACEACNRKKNGKHPDELAGDIVSRLPFLRSYLASVSTGQNTAPRTHTAPLFVRCRDRSTVDKLDEWVAQRRAELSAAATDAATRRIAASFSRNDLVLDLIDEALMARKASKKASP